MHSIAYHTVLIKDIVLETPGVKRLFIQYPEPIDFKPGQFVILKFEGLQHQFDTRSYSIAGQTTRDTLELCIVVKEDGAATPLIFEKGVGETLLSSMPEGRFTLPEESIDKPYFFICTGTGVAPFRCMVHELLHTQKYTQPVHLFFGCRTQKDLLYYEEFKQIELQYPNFKYYPVLSREAWDGLTGYVHPHYLSLIQQQPPAVFYLCGWTEMIKETRDNIKALGYTRQDIKVEFYD
ncbi:MAG: FAD-binding oxidoreductase [Bacteroidota bacterium]